MERQDARKQEFRAQKKRASLLKLLLVGGAYETRTRDPMRDRHVF